VTSVGDPTAKVLFRVVGPEGDVNVETLLAFDLGHIRYRLDNSPFYAYSVSVGDVVLAPLDPNEGFPTFKAVVEKCGNRTVRVVFEKPVEAGNVQDQLLQGLVSMGCEYEGANRSYICITVPPHIDFEAVQNYLTSNDVNWEHADPSYSELYGDDA